MSSAPDAGPEQVTHAVLTDLSLPDGAGTLALITLDNGLGRPATLGPLGLAQLRDALSGLARRAEAGELAAVAVTGTGRVFAAGADLDVVEALPDTRASRSVAELGHSTLRLLGELAVPTFAFVNGAAVGGGLELALHCTYRTAAADVRALALPEVRLGLVPGWGGCWLLPRLVGVTAALDVICRRALTGRMTTAAEALEMGLVDHLVDPARPVEDSLAWVAQVLAGRQVPRRPLDDATTWEAATTAARADVARRLGDASPAAQHAVELVAAARASSRHAAFAAEDDVLTELLVSPQARAGVYAQRVTTRAARRPASDGSEAPAGQVRQVRAVGVVGGGLMASQLAVLLAQRLAVPVAMREVDEERADLGRERVGREIAALVRAGRLDANAAAHLEGLVTIGTDLGALGSADLVIEAVTEVMGVKQQVFAELESLVAPDAVLATNTSALSVTTMGSGLAHPERVVGLHFFNPVARMPLVEVVHTPHTDPATRATGLAVAQRLGKTAVAVLDRPGFVVNRVLLRLLGDVLGCAATGTPVAVADAALRPLGLPMGPFTLIQLVGPAVADHVLTTLRTELGDRFPDSPGLRRLAADGRPLVGPGPGGVDEPLPWVHEAFGAPAPSGRSGPQVLDHVLAGLAQEVGALLAEGVVPSPQDVDVCMILGAGWPYHLGGITPYLDRTGWSERVLGHRFHDPRTA